MMKICPISAPTPPHYAGLPGPELFNTTTALVAPTLSLVSTPPATLSPDGSQGYSRDEFPYVASCADDTRREHAPGSVMAIPLSRADRFRVSNM